MPQTRHQLGELLQLEEENAKLKRMYADMALENTALKDLGLVTAEGREAGSAVIDAINAVLKKTPRAGFWKCYGRLRRAGHRFNHKRVYRVYCRLGLNLPRRVKRKLPERAPKPLAVKPIE